MSKFRELHDLAMNWAQEGHLLLRTEDSNAARVCFQRAAENERAAFELLVEPPSSEPTWTIIAVSVASLYYKAGNCERAIFYARQVLDNPLARPSSYHRREAESIVESCGAMPQEGEVEA